jgi:hypothetical protein
LSRVEKIVAEQLANQPSEAIPNGHRYRLASGITELTFRPVVSGPTPSDVSHIATVETQFVEDMPDFSQAELERLNRRSAFGNFYRADDGIRSKATYSIYKDEPNPQWVAFILLIAFVQQQRLGLGIAQADLSDELGRANRASLNYPRNWTRSVPQDAFKAFADDLWGAGYASSTQSDGLTVNIKLAEDSSSCLQTSETALLHITTGIRHPLAGAGYLGTIELPFDPPQQHIIEWSEYLNEQEHKQEDFPPRLGAWGLRGLANKLVYVLFIPADEGDANVVWALTNWLIMRTLWIKRAFWQAGSGLHRPGAEGNG